MSGRRDVTVAAVVGNYGQHERVGQVAGTEYARLIFLMGDSLIGTLACEASLAAVHARSASSRYSRKFRRWRYVVCRNDGHTQEAVLVARLLLMVSGNSIQLRLYCLGGICRTSLSHARVANGMAGGERFAGGFLFCFMLLAGAPSTSPGGVPSADARCRPQSAPEKRHTKSGKTGGIREVPVMASAHGFSAGERARPLLDPAREGGRRKEKMQQADIRAAARRIP